MPFFYHVHPPNLFCAILLLVVVLVYLGVAIWMVLDFTKESRAEKKRKRREKRNKNNGMGKIR